MSLILLDTNILVDISRGHEPTAQRVSQLSETAELMICTVTYLELIEGCRNKESLRSLEIFVANFQILQIDTACSRRAISLMQSYNLSHGLLLADALIAAIALENTLPLLTRNTKDFRFIEGLSLIA